MHTQAQGSLRTEFKSRCTVGWLCDLGRSHRLWASCLCNTEPSQEFVRVNRTSVKYLVLNKDPTDVVVIIKRNMP